MHSLADFGSLSDSFRKNLINSITGFKSVTLIGTKSTEGKTNLAIFSQVIHIGANPPLIGVLFRPHVVPRHTLENILATQQFTINHIHESQITAAHHTSARWDTSEFEACGFTAQFRDDLLAPFVAESPIKIGLKMVEKVDIQANGTHLIIGEIQCIMTNENVIGTDGFVNLEAAGIVTCSGLDSYHTTNKVTRLSYAKPDHPPYAIG